MLKIVFAKIGKVGTVLAVALILFGLAPEASAQWRLPELGRIGDSVNVQIKVGEITLESTERRFDQSFSGEVPLRTVVDAASILRARRLGEGRSSGTRIWDALPW